MAYRQSFIGSFSTPLWSFLQKRQKVFKAVSKKPAPSNEGQAFAAKGVSGSKENLVSMRKIHIQVSIPDVS